MGSAARAYFGKEAGRLDAGEAALIAGMIRAPNLYTPLRHPDRARQRRDLVLRMMLERGDLSEAAAERARRAPLRVRRATAPPRAGRYFLDYVREQGGAHDKGAVFTTLDLTLQLAAEDAIRQELSRLERERPALGRCGDPLQAAMVVLDPRTGAVLAMVGGRDYGTSQFNRAAHAARQPGSAFKPVVALAALAGRSHTLATVLQDEPLAVETPAGLWEPANYDQEYRGGVTLREALERSLNVPFARLGLAIGPDRIVRTARRLGIQSPLRAVPSLALGSADLTPLELARAYGVLAAEGMLARTHAVATPDVSTNRVFERDEAWLVTSALEGAVERGTGRGLRSLGYRGRVAAKSGTTNDHRDAWFVGYTSSLVVAVWVGFDDGRSVGLPGARAALPVFARFLTLANGDGGSDWSRFDPPANIDVVEVDRDSGLRAGWGCSGQPEYFLEGTAPDEEAEDCDSRWWPRRWIASESGRAYREWRPRIEQEYRRRSNALAEELRRHIERYGRE